MACGGAGWTTPPVSAALLLLDVALQYMAVDNAHLFTCSDELEHVEITQSC